MASSSRTWSLTVLDGLCPSPGRSFFHLSYGQCTPNFRTSLELLLDPRPPVCQMCSEMSKYSGEAAPRAGRLSSRLAGVELKLQGHINKAWHMPMIPVLRRWRQEEDGGWSSGNLWLHSEFGACTVRDLPQKA